MGFADAVAVNSGFTKGVVGKVWPGLERKMRMRMGGRRNGGLEVVYPCVDVREKATGKEKVGEEEAKEGDESLGWRDRDIILSINRFEAKKDVGLAIKAYAGLGMEGRKGVRLVVAGKITTLSYFLFYCSSSLGINLLQLLT
jgi:alpha-1,3/alpha-1,6-mannosyltransferase